ncbi:2,3-diaminopropionate biosynthesis protein SbnA [Micromonospora sp. HNM0581]|uniref:2,3-diaminopropionate biosynthesis protein SbnA n=1 Tax=Micromonospora sp. HNM0581 TaxID=2716341 RepID=UPI00146BFF95|nr:2,3-diaminopropionate biosynthesis protein SbnA [Micromonospora sp. HNM0581]NLU78159.1 2,3-diaminopropionate biosynthesis protein SbnA [Micromonospora sp. HNM0581]
MVVFAHSGSGPNALLPAVRQVPGDVEIVGVTLPGRERRFRERFTEPYPDAVAGAIAAALHELDPLPTAFLGHSLGAQLAMAVAGRAPRLCQALLLSACPPATPLTGGPLGADQVVRTVELAGGASREILDEPSLRDWTIEVLRTDLELGRRLAAESVSLPVPPLVAGGADDELVTPPELRSLARQRGVSTGPRFLPGGHFYLLDERNRSAFRLLIDDLLDAARRGADSRPASFGTLHELPGFQPGFSTHVTLEGLNPAGSIKIRTAHQLLREAEQDGRLGPGARIIESTSGNLGVAMAALCARQGYRLTLVMDPNANRRSIRVAEQFGATVVRVTERDAAGGYLATRIRYIQDRVAADPGLIWLNQYANPANLRAHSRWTAPEFLDAFGTPDWLFVGAGTTGTLMGCLDAIETRGLPTRVVAVDSVGSLLSGGPARPRMIPGLGASRIPEIFDPARAFTMVAVEEAHAVAVCRHVARHHGLLLGGSSGSVLAAVCLLRDDIPPGARVLVVSPDMGDGYLETVYDDDWVREAFGPKVLDAEDLSYIRPADYAGVTGV